MFSSLLRGTILLALAALVTPKTFALIDIPANVAAQGGEDVVVFQSDTLIDDDALDLAVAPNGDYYAVVMENMGVGQGMDLRVLRSTDGGDTWSLFGTKGAGMAQSFWYPEISIVTSPTPRLVLAYVYLDNGQYSVNVSYSPLGPSASWTALGVFSDPTTNFTTFSMAEVEAPGGTILYMAAEESRAGENNRIWFSRSITQGASWQAPYVIATPSPSYTLDYRWPHVAGDEVGNVHVAYEVDPQFGSIYDHGIYYRHADNRGVQLADWDTPLVIASANDGYESRFAGIGCQLDGSKVLISYMGSAGGGAMTSQRIANGNGTGWSAPIDVDVHADYAYGVILAHPDGGWVATGSQTHAENSPFSGWGTSRSLAASPLNWVGPTFFSDQSGSFLLHGGVAVIDPTRGNQVAMLWSDVNGDTPTDYLRFDAEWRDAPGYPSLEESFPITAAPVTEPLLHEVNPFRPGPELVYGDTDGKIHVIDTTTGEDVPGWPKQIGVIGWKRSVAVGDLDGNGIFDVVASDTNGDVWAWRGDGQLLPGWPVNVGSNISYVSLAPVSKLAPLDVVVAAGDALHLFRPNGVEVEYGNWPRALMQPPVAPASLGDVDNDGSIEVVVTGDFRVSVFDEDGSVLWLGILAPGMVAPTSLGDLDADGDLELLIPGGDGTLHARHHDGSVVAGFWPQVASAGFAIQGIAMAKIDAADGLEVAATTFDGKAHLYRSTGFPYTGFPKSAGVAPYNCTPILDDVDGGRPEMLTADGGGGLRGYKENDVDLGGWPKDYGSAYQVAPVAGDVDGDGQQKLIYVGIDAIVKVSTNDLAGAAEDTRWPMYAHDAQRTSAAEESFDAITPAPEFGQTMVHFAPPSPNPVQGQTMFSYRLPSNAQVSLDIFDLRGRRVRTLIDGTQAAGDHQIAWDARDGSGARVGQGQYFGRLQVQGDTVNEKLVQRITVLR